MIYLNDGHLLGIGIRWPLLSERIEQALGLIGTPEAVQPLKPYLRFGHPANRIIAMPAYVGGEIGISGIKWIASFPGNVGLGLPRAHGTIVLNDPATGIPVAFFNGGLLNQLRTAAVSSVMLKAYFALDRRRRYKLGLIGWGPIGRRHLDMISALFGDRVESASLFDLRGIDPGTIDESWRGRAKIVSSWQEAYRSSDIVLTCTAASERYIDEPPVPGALLLNVSLRDYEPSCVQDAQAVVDDWREVCRENTDVERLHLAGALREDEALTLSEAVFRQSLHSLPESRTVFFNPMGMAVFDLAIAEHYRKEAERLGAGIRLDD